MATAVRSIGSGVRPVHLTGASLVACVLAGVSAAAGWRWASVVLWLSGRILDGLDGALARHRNTTSDLGGYLDMLGDTIGYAAVLLGVAATAGQRA